MQKEEGYVLELRCRIQQLMARNGYKHVQLNCSKVTCSLGIKYTLDFEDSAQKQEFKISSIIII